MAQYGRTNYKALYGLNGSEFPDNTSGLITEGKVRSFGEDGSDSFFNLTDDAYKGAKGIKVGVSTLAGLKAIATTSIETGVFVAFRDTGNGNVLRVYELASGADSESSPDTLRPDDYAASTNEKVWKLAGNFTYESKVVTAAGTDTYTADLSPAISSYVTGARYYVQFTNANTGGATLNLNSLGAVAIMKDGGSVLEAEDIHANQIIELVYDGTNLQIIGGSTSTASSPIVSGGTYTPTLSNVSNISSSTAYEARYIRIQNNVTVSGTLDLNESAISQNTSIRISLPIASDFGNELDCSGLGSFYSTSSMWPSIIKGNTTFDTAEMSYDAKVGSSTTIRWYYNFMYKVITGV